MYAWSNIEDAKPCGYLGTELNATDKCLHTHSKARLCGRTRRILHKPVFASRNRTKKVEDTQTFN